LAPMILLLLSSAAAFQLTRVPVHEPARRMITRTCGDVRAALGVKHLISDLEFLGPCRFIVSGKGAILEAVGAFEGLRESKKGLATVSNDDNSFECHIRLNEVRSAQFATKDTPDGRTLRIVRLLGEERAPLLSAILHPDEGEEVDESAIKYWEGLRERFGDDVELALDEDE